MFPHQEIEAKWRNKWAELLKNGESSWLFDEARALNDSEKVYLLDMFPYPSGSGLHVGHVEEKVALDIYARYLRMQGKNVLMPTGYDSFGLPTENYALKNGLTPQVATAQNTHNFHEQTENIGISYDWTRELATSDPEYYKFTQWWFLFLYERGLAYRKKQSVNWCPQDQTVLANEQVIEGRCERCDSLVVQKEMEQWFFRITDYADRLLSDLDKLDWPESTKQAQRNWIGKSTGINITYPIKDNPDLEITVFTTRPDTNFGATFIAVAPDSQFVRENKEKFPNAQAVQSYVDAASSLREIERTSTTRQKTGVDTGLKAINQLNGKELPIFVSDFVLGTVGTGALVGVPGHDMRDFEFAQALGLEIIRVVVGPDGDTSEITKPEQVQEESGQMVNSGFLDGLEILDAKEKIMDYLEEKGWGRRVVNYRLRDWSISRQRYWGAPIPMVYVDPGEAESADASLYQQKADAVFNFVAFGSTPQDHFYPWLQKQLALEGIETLTPEMPQPEAPVLEEWLRVAEEALASEGANETRNSNIVVTGRSLGAWSALKLAERMKIRKLVLIAPTVPTSDRVELWQQHPATAAALERLTDFIGLTKQANEVDFAKVADNCGEVVVYLSLDDPYVNSLSTKQYLRERLPFARFVDYRQAGHFAAADGFAAFPELVKELLRPVRLDIKPELENHLPVILPIDADYKPQGTAPLGTSQSFNDSLKKEVYGDSARREIDTMDTFVCSSWYFFRFLDPRNGQKFADQSKLNKFGPVDFYIGGAEHTVLHLLYSRFFTKVAYDAGLIDYDEPFLKLRHQGLILGPDNRKMSKRWGNVINPNDVISAYGADTLRMYEMFMGPLDQTKSWNDGGVRGIHRFLQKVYDLQDKVIELNKSDFNESAKVVSAIVALAKKVGNDINSLKFNTAISEMMKFINLLGEENLRIKLVNWGEFLKIIYPFAPFLSSELWEISSVALGKSQSLIDNQPWPKFDQLEINHEVENVTIVVMINGKLRDQLKVPKGTQKSTVVDLALASEKVQRYVKTKDDISKEIFVQDKLINLVVKN